MKMMYLITILLVIIAFFLGFSTGVNKISAKIIKDGRMIYEGQLYSVELYKP